MAGRMTNTDTHLVLNNRFGSATATLVATYYLGLSTTTPAVDGTGATEPSGNGYARVAITNNTTNWPAAANRVKSNGVVFTFPTATPAGWGDATHFLLYDALTGGNLRAYGPLTGSPVTIAAGETRAFPVGSIVITAPSA